MDNILNKIISTADGNKYVILDYTTYNNVVYCMGVDIVDNHPGDEIAIFKLVQDGENINLIIEPDMTICEELIKQFKIQNEEV